MCQIWLSCLKNEDIIHSIYFKRNESSVVACTRTLGALFDTLVYCSIGFNGKGRQAGERTNFALLHTHSLFGLLWRDRCRFGELREEVNGNWEDNRRVLLCCDGTQSLIRKKVTISTWIDCNKIETDAKKNQTGSKFHYYLKIHIILPILMKLC